MSEIADKIESMLRELFPYNIILKEHYVHYKGTRLFFDFFVKDLRICVECQGQQHFKFVKHFHGSMEGFFGQKKRDNLKLEYIENNDTFSLVRIRYDEEITKKLLLSKIEEALTSDKGYV
jgi:hypothetical protein